MSIADHILYSALRVYHIYISSYIYSLGRVLAICNLTDFTMSAHTLTIGTGRITVIVQVLACRGVPQSIGASVYRGWTIGGFFEQERLQARRVKHRAFGLSCGIHRTVTSKFQRRRLQRIIISETHHRHRLGRSFRYFRFINNQTPAAFYSVRNFQLLIITFRAT